MGKNVKIIIGVMVAFFIGNVALQIMRMGPAMEYLTSQPELLIGMIVSSFFGLFSLIIPILIFSKIFGAFGKGFEGLKNIDLKKPDSWKDFAKNLPQQLNTMNTLATQKNFENLVAPEAGNPNGLKGELVKFKKIKNIKEVDPMTLDLTAVYEDGSEHLYRATIKGTKSNFQILALSRYS